MNTKAAQLLHALDPRHGDGMKLPSSVLAAHEAVANIARDGLVDPAVSTASSPRWPAAAPVAPDRTALALPFFDTAGDAARHAAQLVVLFELFGFRVLWAAVARDHCYRYYATVSVKPDPARCDVLDVLLAAARGFVGVSRAGLALHWADLVGHFGCVAHTIDPDSAARRLVEEVLRTRNEVVTLIASRLLDLRPLNRTELLGMWSPTPHDPHAALLTAADRDAPCAWPMPSRELPGI